MNVARYFAGRTPDSGLLGRVLREVSDQVPDIVMVLVFPISSSQSLGIRSLQERYSANLRLRCCANGEDDDVVALQEAAAPGARSCLLSNDHFQDMGSIGQL